MAQKLVFGKSPVVADLRKNSQKPTSSAKRVQLVDTPVVKKGKASQNVEQHSVRKLRRAVPVEIPVVKKKKTPQSVVQEKVRRVHNTVLAQQELRSPVNAGRAVQTLEALLDRVEVQEFRGRKVRPQLILSKMENNTLQDALNLFQLKVTMQASRSA